MDDRCHRIGLGSYQRPFSHESIGLVQHQHHSAHGSSCHQGAEELPGLLLGRGGAEVVSYLQVGYESARHTEGRAYHAANDHRSHHPRIALKAGGNQHQGGDDEGHYGHTGYRVAAHDGNGVRSHGGEEEGDDGDYQQAHYRLPHVLHHSAEGKEGEHRQQGYHYARDHRLHLYIPVGFLHGLGRSALLAEFFPGKADGALDDPGILDDAEDAGGRDAADTYMARVRAEDLIRTHLPYGLGNAAAHEIQHLPAEEEVESGDDEQPHQQASQADYEGVLESDDISQAQHGSTGVELEDHLRFVRDGVPYAYEGGGDGLRPGSEGGDGEVVQTSDEAGERQGLSALAAALAVHQHLGGGGCLGEGILPVHLLHEIFTEGDEEEDSQHAAQQTAQEHMREGYIQS